MAVLLYARLVSLDAQWTISQDQASHSNCFIQCSAIRNNLVNQAEPKQPLGGHNAASERELHRYPVGHLTGKPEQATTACGQAPCDLGNAEFRTIRGNDQVARQCQFDASRA